MFACISHWTRGPNRMAAVCVYVDMCVCVHACVLLACVRVCVWCHGKHHAICVLFDSLPPAAINHISLSSHAASRSTSGFSHYRYFFTQLGRRKPIYSDDSLISNTVVAAVTALGLLLSSPTADRL